MTTAKGRVSVIVLETGDHSALWACLGECVCWSCVPLGAIFNSLNLSFLGIFVQHIRSIVVITKRVCFSSPKGS